MNRVGDRTCGTAPTADPTFDGVDATLSVPLDGTVPTPDPTFDRVDATLSARLDGTVPTPNPTFDRVDATLSAPFARPVHVWTLCSSGVHGVGEDTNESDGSRGFL